MRIVRFTEEGRKIAQIFKVLRRELQKDFIARKKLNLLKEVVSKANGANKEDLFKILAPVRTELGILKEQSKDAETLEMVKSLENKVIEMLR